MSEIERKPVTEEDLNAFLAAGQKRIAEFWEQQKFTHAMPILEVDPRGKKYIRIWSVDNVGRSAWAFVERDTGVIMKPDGYKRPAPQNRGSIHSEQHGYEYVSWTGPGYLR